MLKKIIFSPAFLAIWLVLSVGISISLFRNLHQITSTNPLLSFMKNAIAGIEKKNKSLQHKIEKANDPFERERVIRDELLMQKPGETILQVEQQANMNQQKPPSITAQQKSESANKGIILLIKEFFSTQFNRLRTLFSYD